MNMDNQLQVVEQNGKTTLKNRVGQALAVGAVTLAPVAAFAAPEAPDVTEAVTYIGLAVVAIGAIGAAKMIPAAATWLWSALTGTVKRG